MKSVLFLALSIFATSQPAQAYPHWVSLDKETYSCEATSGGHLYQGTLSRFLNVNTKNEKLSYVWALEFGADLTDTLISNYGTPFFPQAEGFTIQIFNQDFKGPRKLEAFQGIKYTGERAWFKLVNNDDTDFNLDVSVLVDSDLNLNYKFQARGTEVVLKGHCTLNSVN